MALPSSMNHELIEKSIEKQTKQRKIDNGDVRVARETATANCNSFTPTIPQEPSKISIDEYHNNTQQHIISKKSALFYAVLCAILVLCCFPLSTIATQNNITTHPLPL
jgi:hypothetical protein